MEYIKIFLLLLCLLIIYIFYKPIKKLVINHYRNNTINKFKKICDKIELNMMIEDSIKVYKNKLEERFTCELNRKIEGTDIFHKIPFKESLNEIDKVFNIDNGIKTEIIKLSKEGYVDELIYSKHPFSPIEKIYIGFSTTKNYGYLIEKKNKNYNKRIYVTIWNLDLISVFPAKISKQLEEIIPIQILSKYHIHKYNEGKTKPISIYVGVNLKYSVKNIMEVFNNILKIFDIKPKIIEQVNKNIEPYFNNECYWLGLTNNNNEYIATIYYSRYTPINI